MPRPTSRLRSPEAVAEARQMYEAGRHRDDIADFLGTRRPTLDRRIRQWNWRRTPKRMKASEASDAAFSDDAVIQEAALPAPETERADLAVSITQAVERELAAIDTVLTRLGGGAEGSSDSERTARTLASLARALKELKQLDARSPMPAAEAQADDMPRDIDEFRRELARRMDALVAERAEPGVPGRPD